MWLIWLSIGLIVGGGILWLVMWLRSRNMSGKWYEWLIGIIGLLLLLFAINNYIGSLQEWEPDAGNMYLLIAGLPGIILAAIAAVLIWRRQRAAG